MTGRRSNDERRRSAAVRDDELDADTRALLLCFTALPPVDRAALIQIAYAMRPAVPGRSHAPVLPRCNFSIAMERAQRPAHEWRSAGKRRG
jgi:hypothetical protein